MEEDLDHQAGTLDAHIPIDTSRLYSECGGTAHGSSRLENAPPSVVVEAV